MPTPIPHGSGSSGSLWLVIHTPILVLVLFKRTKRKTFSAQIKIKLQKTFLTAHMCMEDYIIMCRYIRTYKPTFILAWLTTTYFIF